MSMEQKFPQEHKEVLGRHSRQYRTGGWANFIDLKGQGDLRWYADKEYKRLGENNKAITI